MPNQLELTKDGSHTVRSGQFDIHYHSHHGAIQESEHVFIEAGLQAYLKDAKASNQLKLLELGLGTGLNVLLSMREAQARPAIHFHYRVVELYPLETPLVSQLNYCSELGLPQAWLEDIHNASWGKVVDLLPNFSLHKQQGDWLQLATSGPKANLVFYDAFAPNSQEELWTEDAFALCAQAMATGGLWTSYCAKGAVKRALRANGFQVTALPGPPGKREMTQATLL